ncbi:MAG: hypothetical protein RLZZ528_1150 [Pseudomonadota bacterium]|jgi:chromosome condensin MukBEF MukE localization factor
MIRALLLLTLAAGPAAAAGDIVLGVENRSGQAIRQLAIFPVGSDGKVVDDVLTSRNSPIADGETVAVNTRLSACQKISVWVSFADATEATVQTDLCRNRRLIATP